MLCGNGLSTFAKVDCKNSGAIIIFDDFNKFCFFWVVVSAVNLKCHKIQTNIGILRWKNSTLFCFKDKT